MSDDTEMIVLLFSQFVSGQINAQQFADSLSKEREKETEKLAILQNNLKCQQSLIDEYVTIANKKIVEIDMLKNQLSEMTIDRDKWKEEYINLLTIDMNVLTAIQIAHKGKFEKLNVTDHGSYASWDKDNDKNYQSYIRARKSIAEHQGMEKILLFLKYI